MKLTLNIWRQKGAQESGQFVKYQPEGLSEDMSFLEMLDVLNEQLIQKGEESVAFEHDCREGICGSCGMVINGIAHGPLPATTTCQLHLRSFRDGEELWIEPWRAAAFPIVKDLVVRREALDRIIQAGGYISINTGSAPEANQTLVPKPDSDHSMDAAACIGCGACVAACPNASAHLFMSSKVSHLGLLPQGQPERYERVLNMVAVHDDLGFGSCTSHGECAKVCPKGISLDFIARMNRDLVRASLASSSESEQSSNAVA